MENKAVMPLSDYQDICNAVREKTGGGELLTSGEVADAIKKIEKGSTVYSGTISIGSSSTFTFTYNFIPTFYVLWTNTGTLYAIIGHTSWGRLALAYGVSSYPTASLNSSGKLQIKVSSLGVSTGTSFYYYIVK